jgi:type III pantothenate kinase
MKALIDIGNTQAKVCLAEDGQLSAVQYFPYQDFLQWLKFDEVMVEEVIFANVAGEQFDTAIKMWALKKGINFTQVYTEAELFGVSNGYHKPEQLGIDRWLAILAANSLYPQQNLIIVDSGTATTVDILTKDGQHCGGWIVPGFELMHQGLLANTTKVFADVNEEAGMSFGLDTSANVNHGCWAASTGVVMQAINQCQKLGLDDLKIIVTGGYGSALVKLLDTECQLIPELIFYGLVRYSRSEK